MKSVSVFGASGSVGQSAADIIAAHADQFTVHTVTANTNVHKLADTATQLKARRAVIADESQYNTLKNLLPGVEVAAGRQALIDAAAEKVDLHLAAIVGMAGLEPLMAALENARSVAIANKEPLVAAGALVMAKAKKHGCTILPVDSEHNAIFQVLEQNNRDAIEKIILTASGGPFREWPLDKMASATREQALKHPNWNMGSKITIDSATMMNKALEVIEAHYLFALPPEKIEVAIHPQSVIHSMVEYRDGSVLAQLGAPDMRTPLTYCLGWPQRLATPGQRLAIQELSNLTFENVDHTRFPAIKLAYLCLSAGQAACVTLNAANEQAVAAFLEGKIGFLAIVESVQKMVQQTTARDFSSLSDILAFDKEIRAKTNALLDQPQPVKRQA